MARKLKTYQTSLGFFDLAVAAPSMKAALEIWGSKSNLFHQGLAKEADDPAVVAATMAAPGVLLKRPVGSTKSFSEHAALPDIRTFGQAKPKLEQPREKQKKIRTRKIDEKTARKAALRFESEQRKREADQKQEEEAAATARERQQAILNKAQRALDEAEIEHQKRADKLEAERVAVEKRTQSEDDRWEKQWAKLQHALRNARNQ
jgi:hypothetical protein